nr:probable cinnamyl alcohol dehydrogenase 6 [Tanacetum cinerariifolium]
MELMTFRSNYCIVGWIIPIFTLPKIIGVLLYTPSFQGLITEVGSNVKGFKIGDRVGVGCIGASCLECEFCKDSQENYCDQFQFTYNGVFWDGSIMYGGCSEMLVADHRSGFVQPDQCPESHQDEDWTRPCAAHEVPLLTVIASRVIDMEDVAGASESLGTPGGGAEDQVLDEMAYEIPSIENASATGVSLEIGLEKEVAAIGPPINKRRCKRGNNEAEANAPPKVLRGDYDTFRPAQSTHGGKSLASMGLDVGSLLSTPAAQDPSTVTKSVSDPEPRSYANPLPHPKKYIAQ